MFLIYKGMPYFNQIINVYLNFLREKNDLQFNLSPDRMKVSYLVFRYFDQFKMALLYGGFFYLLAIYPFIIEKSVFFVFFIVETLYLEMGMTNVKTVYTIKGI